MGAKRARKLSFFAPTVYWLTIFWGATYSCQLYSAVESKRLLSFHFDKIEVRGALTLFVKPGKRNRQVEYFADSTIIDTVSVHVRNRTLFLDANNSYQLTRKIPLIRLSAQRTFPIEVIVSIEELKELSLLENSRARLDNLAGKELKLFLNSTGSFHLTNSKFEKINLRQEGSGSAVLKGREIIELSAEVYGSGSLLGEELFLDNAVVRHHGSGEILLAPGNWLDAQIYSSGNLHLLEKPLGRVIKNEGKGGEIIEEY